MATVVATATEAVYPAFIPPSSLVVDTTPIINNNFTSKDFISKEQRLSVHKSSVKEDVHVINNINHDNKASNAKSKTSLTRSIHNSNRRKIIPSEFEHWIEAHGGEQNFSKLINLNHYATISRRKRSRLSFVSYSSSSSSSSSEGEEEDETDFIPAQDDKQRPKEEIEEQSIEFPSRTSSITTVHNYNTKTMTKVEKHLINTKRKSNEDTIPTQKDVQPHIETQRKNNATAASATTTKSDVVNIKKNSWFNTLFNKQNNSSTAKSQSTSATTTISTSKKSPPTGSTTIINTSKKSPTTTITNFFTLKKQQQKETALMSAQQKKKNNIPRPYKLPTRYPLPIERVIYQISFMKISNPRRPLQHQVTISNMIFWYASTIQKEVYNGATARSTVRSRSTPFYQNLMHVMPPRSVSQ